MVNLFWYSENYLERGNTTNFGDELSPFIVKNVSGKNVRWYNPLGQNFIERTFKKNYFGIGSIIEFGANNSHIWGSGLIKTNGYAPPKAKFYAVRGPNTRNELKRRGIDVPDIFGDPGLLTPKYYPDDKKTKKYSLGIIPHYVEVESILNSFPLMNISSEIKIIDFRKSIESVLDDILLCDRIVSSSLHGIIIPQAYNIPTLRIKISNKIYGDDIKYRDYFDSVGIEEYQVPFLNDFDNIESIFNFLKSKEKQSNIIFDLEKIQNGLINSSPF